MNPTHAVILRKARAILVTGQEIMICLAIERVMEKYPQLTKEGLYLQKYIMGQLGPWQNFRQWQERRGIYHDAAQRRQDRINWISWMLGEL